MLPDALRPHFLSISIGPFQQRPGLGRVEFEEQLETTMKERQDDNPRPPEEIRDRIWELAEKIDVCMFTTWDGNDQHSRPLSARVRKDEHSIYFLVDEAGEKNGQVGQYPTVSCAWADNGNYKYVLVGGQAVMKTMTGQRFRNSGPREMRPGGRMRPIRRFAF